MGIDERREVIRRIEKKRDSRVICFVTTLRPNVVGMIAGDSVPVFFDHLLGLGKRPVDQLDIFLCSNGGDGTVPWRLVALFREFANRFNVLIPYRAYSAASLLALGANEIVMHPFAELGPIDPTVSNEFNPEDPRTGQKRGISVEDVTAYVHFIKDTVGITHEDELVRAIEILAQQVHPIALGNIERFISQSRMIAQKILRTHMASTDAHVIDEIVENMASKLYFHGHPINRREARDELKLKVGKDPDLELERLMWELYKDFEAEFGSLAEFNPAAELAAVTAKATDAALAHQAAAATAQAAGQPPPPPPLQPPPYIDRDLLHAVIESDGLSSRFTTRHRYTRAQVILPPQPIPQIVTQDELLESGWSHSRGQPAVARNRQSGSVPAGAPSAGATARRRRGRSSQSRQGTT